MNVNANMLRYGSPVVLTAVTGLLFWLKPDVTPEMFGATTPERGLLLAAGIFIVFWAYLVIQGYPLSHGNIGSSSSHNLDNMVSFLPAMAAIIGIFLTLVGFWPLSHMNLFIAVTALAVVVYDLWILGGVASRINRLTDEIKTER